MAKKSKKAKKAEESPAAEGPTTESAVDKSPDKSKVWSIFSMVSAIAAATVAKKALNSTWRAATGKKPPANPHDPDVAIGEAVAWAAASGTIIALARMLAQRRAADYYARSTGHSPPGLGADADEQGKKGKKS